MKTIYEVLTEGTEPFVSQMIKKTDADGSVWIIPTDPANSDYQRYLKWLENPEAEETPNTL